MKRKALIKAINSDYFAASNRLAPKSSRRRIVAYVESYDDVFFWRTILSQVEDETTYFEVLLPTQDGRLGRGKKCVLSMIGTEGFGSNMIACVDADYDFLMQGATEHSRQMLQTPFVFHTHAYAIENWQCWAPSLHQVAVMVTLNDRRIFDYQLYMRRYSEIVYPLFLWSIWIYRRELFGVMSIGNMNNIIAPSQFTLDNPDASLQTVRGNVRGKLQRLQKRFPEFGEEEQKKLADELAALGVTPADCYLFLHGHHLLQHVVTPMLTSVCGKLRNQRERDIRSQALHQAQRNTELAGYTHATEDVASMLRKNTMWISAPLMQQIISKIKGDCLNAK